jgi:steroid delta-isomerase-like uncharacterized protein
MTNASTQPFLNQRTEKEFLFLGLPTTLRAGAESTAGAFGLIEHQHMSPGFETPYHLHHREDEAFYVLSGQMAFVVDGKWFQASAGSFVYGPREIAHGFKVIGDGAASMLVLCAPGGFEKFVIELGKGLDATPAPPDMAELMAAAARFEIDILGPLPAMDASAMAAPELDACAVGRLWIEAFNRRDWALEESLRTADFTASLSGQREALDSGQWQGFLKSFAAAFPDSRIEIHMLQGEGDTTTCRWTMSGTHEGEFNGIPATGKAIRFDGIEINRYREGKIVQHFAQFDMLALLGQIGALPA